MSDARSLIVQAFADAPSPVTAADIAPHRCPECDRIVEDLQPHTFDTVPPEVLEYHRDSLPLPGPQGLQHYLPAWLLYALDHLASDVMMFTIFHLTPVEKNLVESKTYFDDRFSRFTASQRNAIAAFFAEIRDRQLCEGYEQELRRAAQHWA